jgi:hypothetical protein
VIRGAPLPGVDRTRTRRLLYPDEGDPATFEETARHWFALDFDHAKGPPLADPVGDPEGIIEYLIGRLPPEFHDAACWWQLSASMAVPLPGTADTVSARLWWWSRVKLTDAELTRWAAMITAAAS